MVADSIDEPPQLPAASFATVRWLGSTVVVTARGELDMATAPGLRWPLTQALRQHPSVVVLDLSAVTFIGSSGLNAVALAGRHLDRAAARVVATSRGVVRPIGLLGLDRVLTLYPSLADALAAS
jgi:anti-sigma B factor antagonist